jgi:mannan endo-1,4-beta-mannosidase
MAGLVRVVRDDGPRLVESCAGGERPFRFVLVNAYYLAEEATRPGGHAIVRRTLAAARRMGARVVRAWAFNDDQQKVSRIQTGRLAYLEENLRGLDAVIALAADAGVRLILPFVDSWSSYGGVAQWLRWNGIDDAREGDPRFYSDPSTLDHYRLHVARLLGRCNTLTGVRYSDDPTVLAWELINEPRATGLVDGGLAIATWTQAAARAVKDHAAQLVSIGDEGADVSGDGFDLELWRKTGAEHLFSSRNGISFTRNLRCADVDLASCHFYPEKYGVADEWVEAAGRSWIAEHARIAATVGKPIVWSELGLATAERIEGRRFRREERLRVYASWLAAAADAGAAGAGPWLFAYDQRPEAWDDFTFYERDGYPELLREAARRFEKPVGSPTDEKGG